MSTPPAWTRTAPLGTAARQQELWTYAAPDVPAREFRVDVRFGKPLDVRALKSTSLQDTRAYADTLRERAARLYHDASALQVADACPCCAAGPPYGDEGLRIYGASYRFCASCHHRFVDPRPDEAVWDAELAGDDAIADTYVDVEAAQVRMAQVAGPKLDWVLQTYESLTGRQPRRIADVGAGGGHFVAACAQRGLDVDGYETSGASRAFAKRHFGIELVDASFLESGDAATRGSAPDIITFWGLLEYLTDPGAFVAAAAARLPADGLLVVEVPRHECLGTAVQQARPGVVARHLDPTTHLHSFSDDSILTLLLRSGLVPVAAWYFGMDAYETIVQAALASGGDALVEELADAIPVLQDALDRGRVCDDLVLAAVPDPGAR